MVGKYVFLKWMKCFLNKLKRTPSIDGHVASQEYCKNKNINKNKKTLELSFDLSVLCSQKVIKILNYFQLAVLKILMERNKKLTII